MEIIQGRTRKFNTDQLKQSKSKNIVGKKIKLKKKSPRDLWDISKYVTYITGVQGEEREIKKNFFLMKTVYT